MQARKVNVDAGKVQVEVTVVMVVISWTVVIRILSWQIPFRLRVISAIIFTGTITIAALAAVIAGVLKIDRI
jgi:hypothetical protein